MNTPTGDQEYGDGLSGHKDEKSHFRIHKIAGGYRVPYHRKSKKHHSLAQALETSALVQHRPKHGFVPNIPAVECAICFGPVKEATVPKCGHMFCHDCIFDWSKVRSWCPLCQGPLKPFIRVYSVDEQVETYYLDNFSQEERAEFEEARVRRAKEQEVRLKHEQGFFPRMMRKYFLLCLYFESKGFWHGLVLLLRRAWIQLKEIRLLSLFTLSIVLLIIFVILLFTSKFSLVHFLKYLWKCIANYPGPNCELTQETEVCALDDLGCGTEGEPWLCGSHCQRKIQEGLFGWMKWKSNTYFNTWF